MRALVAGGAGFIGSNLIGALLAAGHSVICIDNFFIGSRQNIAHLEHHPRFQFYEQDLSELEPLIHIFEKEPVDFVFHMAANSDIQASAKHIHDNIQRFGSHAHIRCKEPFLLLHQRGIRRYAGEENRRKLRAADANFLLRCMQAGL